MIYYFYNIGTVSHPDWIGVIISNVLQSYKEAVDIIHCSGEGLQGEEYVNFSEKLKAT